MRSPIALLKCVAKALVKYGGNALLGGFGGDLLVEVLPEVAGDAWSAWTKERDGGQRRAEVQEIAQVDAGEILRQAAAIVQEVAADQPPQVRLTLASYLTQVPATVRASLRRPTDPTGTTVPAGLTMEKPDDLLPFLPARLPRFRPGDRPLAGVPWVLEELLGVGGFGEVWKAANPDLPGLTVALKFCLDPKARDQLLNHEARVIAQVQQQGKHPGIVELRQAYLSADPPCLEYEYVAGGDLAGLLTEQSQGLPPVQVAKIVSRLADTIGYAHQLKPPIVHRDLKPANILVQRTKESKIALRIADFGIGGVAAGHAITQETRPTTAQQLRGTALRGAHTPLYASEQQKRGEPPDPRDDVHALGVIWYQLATGNLAAGRPGGSRWQKRLLERGLSAPMIDLLASCLEDDPADRPATAAVLAKDLAALLKSAPPTAIPPTPALSAPPLQAKPAPAPPPEPVGEVRRFKGHTGPIQSVLFTPDGRMAVSGSADKTIRFWDLKTGKEIRRLEGTHPFCLAFSPDGRRLVSGSITDKTIRSWDIETGEPLHTVQLAVAQISSLVFAPGAHQVATAHSDHTFRLWDSENGRSVRCLEHSRMKSPILRGIAPDGRTACSIQWSIPNGASWPLMLWDLEAEEVTEQMVTKVGLFIDHVLAFAPKEPQVMIGRFWGSEVTMALHDLQSGGEVRRYEGHTDNITHIAFLPDGRRVLSAAGNVIRLFDVGTGKRLDRYEGDSKVAGRLTVSPDGHYALSGAEDNTVRLWRLPS